MRKGRIVTEYARMWPREVFDFFEKRKLVVGKLQELKHSGVYILYRDDTPYYIGKTRRALVHRLHAHANQSRDRYFNFWNYFSVFIVPNPKHVDEIEGILIASMSTANSVAPKIEQIKLPNEIAKRLRELRKEAVLTKRDREDN